MRAYGIMRGKVVELEEAPGFPDGQRVNVELTPAQLARCAPYNLYL